MSSNCLPVGTCRRRRSVRFNRHSWKLVEFRCTPDSNTAIQRLLRNAMLDASCIQIKPMGGELKVRDDLEGGGEGQGGRGSGMHPSIEGR